MTYSIQHETRGSIAPAAPQPVQAGEQGGYGALAAATYVDEFIPIPYDEGPVVPASHMSFDVTVQQGADTQGQLDRVLREIRSQIPADKFVIQEINVRGTVFTGGRSADLDHNRALARRNEDYVSHYLTLAELRPEVANRPRRHLLTPQAQSDTQLNAVRVDVVYRSRNEDDSARAGGPAARNPRCGTRQGAAADVDPHPNPRPHPIQERGLAVDMAPSVILPMSEVPPYELWPDSIPQPQGARPGEDKVWLRRCPIRRHA